MSKNIANKNAAISAIVAAAASAFILFSPAAVAADQLELPPQPPILMTTTDSLDGYRVKEYKGIVRGVMVREPGPVSNFKASLKGIVGGKISPYIRLCETARQHAVDDMVQRAMAMGANAVIGFRFDSSAFGDNSDMVTEVVCYGTAVVIEAHTQKAASLAPQDSLQVAGARSTDARLVK